MIKNHILHLHSPWSVRKIVCVPNILYTVQVDYRKEGGKTSSFKMRRERVRTECQSSWIPFWREKGGLDGQEKRGTEEGRKYKGKS